MVLDQVWKWSNFCWNIFGCCKMFCAFGQLLHNMPQHDPTVFWIFFQVLFTTTRFSSVLSCEDLLISSLHRSANIWIFIYLNSSFTLMFIWTQFIDQLNDPIVLQGVALKCWVLLTGLPHSFVNSSLSGHPTFMNSSQFLYCKKWNFKSNSINLLGSFFTLDVLRPHLHNIN